MPEALIASLGLISWSARLCKQHIVLMFVHLVTAFVVWSPKAVKWKPNGAACNLSLTTHEQLQEIPDAPSIKTPVSCLPNRPLLLQTSDSVSTHTFLCLHTGLHIKHCTTIVVLIMSSIQPSNSGKRLVKIQDHKHKMQNKSDSAKAICMRLQEIQRSHWVPGAS